MKTQYYLYGVLITLLCISSSAVFAQGLIIDHTCTDLSQIPSSWIDQAQLDLHIAYEHTSHGSQLITGMQSLEDYPPFAGEYEFTDDGSAGLDLDDHGIPGVVNDLSTGDYIDEFGVTPWVTGTRTLLDDPDNSHINVVMWSWCSINMHNPQRYVDNMEILISEYPDITFVFMTGHAEQQGENLYDDPQPNGDGHVHYNNELIRAHCIAHNRLLFDFADIESYNPDGSYFWDLNMNDNLNYTGGNWAVEWIAANTGSELEQLTTGEGVTGYGGCTDCAHSSSPDEANLNCILKGRAVWWMMACINDGDVNLNNSLSAEDAQLAFSITLGTMTPTYEQECAADCNSSGSVTAADAQNIFFATLGTGTCSDPI